MNLNFTFNGNPVDVTIELETSWISWRTHHYKDGKEIDVKGRFLLQLGEDANLSFSNFIYILKRNIEAKINTL